MTAPEPGACFEVFTLFPEVIEGFVQSGLVGKAIDRGLLSVHATSYRDFATDRHRSVDDTPFGGGAGMVIQPGPVVAAIREVERLRGSMHTVLLTPSAPRFDQAAARRLAALPRIGLLCGRYEGIDDRVREAHVDECLSIGDFVLNGGEVAALVLIEAIGRLHGGVLGNAESVEEESFAGDGQLLEHPQFTRPVEFEGVEVPPVLRGGDHGAVAVWRRTAAIVRTRSLRPELRPTPPWTRPRATTVLVTEPPTEVARAALSSVGGLGVRVTEAGALRAELRGAKKRLRRGGERPVVVGIPTDAIPVFEPVPRDADTLMDVLLATGGEGGSPGSPLVAVFAPWEALDTLPLDARFAPPAGPSGEKNEGHGLANGAGMIDPSQPQPVWGGDVGLVPAVLRRLMIL